MDFRILGPLEAVHDGRAADLGGARQRALLAILLLRRNEVVPAERLLEDLYGADQPATAAKSLQAHVSRLRRVLDPDRVRTRGNGYVLQTEPGEVDADVFARLLDEGRSALSSGRPVDAERALRDALDLWRGPALDDVAYEDFAQTEIARLQELRLAALDALCEARLALGRHDEIVPELEGLVAERPHHERLRGLLMLALYRSGRQADALAVYRETRETLLDELGLEPGKELQGLERLILRQDASLDVLLDPADGVATAHELPDAGPAAAAGSPTREARKTVTALFVGVEARFAGLDELDPETLRRSTRHAFEEVRAAIELHGGSIEAVAGEAVTAVFGLPQVHEDDAIRALRGAAEARRRLLLPDEQLEEPSAVRLEVRIGVATGSVLAGDATATQLRVTGAPLATSSRLARLAQPGQILLDAATTRLARSAATVEPAGTDSPEVLRLVELVDVDPRLVRRFVSPMVGREREHRRLVDAFDQATSDRSCQLFTVLGSAGVGKSRLVREFLGAIGARATVATGRCLPYGEGITYWPVLEVIKSLAGLDDADPPETTRARLAALLEGSDEAGRTADQLARTIGSGDDVSAVDESASAIRELFETLAARHPLVVVFDDIHWGEATFLDLVEHLADSSRVAPILLVCVARPELLDVRPGWAGGKPNATSALLGPLSDDECARLIENLVGAADVARGVRARIAEAAEGNPLFVEEMLSMLVDDGALVRENGGWTATRDLDRVAVPPTIHALLAARLDQLPPDERATIEAAAVEGKVFHRGSVESLSADRAAVAAALDALVRKELVRPEPPVFSAEHGYRFRHLLIRDAAYESIPKEARADLHERHAGWLEAKAGERAVEYEEILGYHLEQAYRFRAELGGVDGAAATLGRRAATHLGTAGRRAFLRSDASAGVNLISRAVAMLPASDRLRVELVPNVRVVQGTPDLSWADRVLTEAVEAAATTGDRRLAGHALVQRGFLRLFTTSAVTPQELIEVSNRAIAVFEELNDELGLARAWRLVAQAHYLDRHLERCAEASERALLHVRLAGDRFEEREIVEWLVIALFLGPAHVSPAIARCERLLEEAGDDRLLQAEVLGGLAPMLAMQGRAAEADDLIERGRAIMDDAGEWIWIVSFWRAWVYLWRGHAVAAEGELRPAYETLKRIGEQSHFSSLSHGLALALYMQGRYEEAEQLTVECEQACRPNDVHSQILWRSTRAKVLARRADFDGALHLAREAVALAREGDFLPGRSEALSDLAEVLRLSGREEEARAALEEAIGAVAQKGHVLAAERARSTLRGYASPSQ